MRHLNIGNEAAAGTTVLLGRFQCCEIMFFRALLAPAGHIRVSPVDRRVASPWSAIGTRAAPPRPPNSAGIARRHGHTLLKGEHPARGATVVYGLIVALQTASHGLICADSTSLFWLLNCVHSPVFAPPYEIGRGGFSTLARQRLIMRLTA